MRCKAKSQWRAAKPVPQRARVCGARQVVASHQLDVSPRQRRHVQRIQHMGAGARQPGGHAHEVHLARSPPQQAQILRHVAPQLTAKLNAARQVLTPTCGQVRDGLAQVVHIEWREIACCIGRDEMQWPLCDPTQPARTESIGTIQQRRAHDAMLAGHRFNAALSSQLGGDEAAAGGGAEAERGDVNEAFATSRTCGGQCDGCVAVHGGVGLKPALPQDADAVHDHIERGDTGVPVISTKQTMQLNDLNPMARRCAA